MNRRNLLLAAACFVGAGAAYGMTPRKHVSLMAGQNLADIVPAAFGGWTSRDVTDLVAPNTQDSLASRLYDQTLERIYADANSGAEVMVLLAHGDTQSNQLQLHRPETCYPAFGFELSDNRQVDLRIGANAVLPGRQMVADAPGRRENVIYWTRLGDLLPSSDNEQRLDRLTAALQGYIADGLLARFSIAAEDSARALTSVRAFIQDFLWATPSPARRGLVGTRIAAAMAAPHV